MNIGIDIDNVISKFNEKMVEEYIKHDKELRNSGIINKEAVYRKGMFDWSQEEEEQFYTCNIERIANSLEVVENAKLYIDKLHEDGNKIIIITGRDNGEYAQPYNMTVNWLNKNNIVYDELILTNAYNNHEKSDVCVKKDIDVMIDDSIIVCMDCLDKGIKALLFDTEYNRKEQNIKRVKNWKEVYNYITSIKT